jgi:hypothetical protein
MRLDLRHVRRRASLLSRDCLKISHGVGDRSALVDPPAFLSVRVAGRLPHARKRATRQPAAATTSCANDQVDRPDVDVQRDTSTT